MVYKSIIEQIYIHQLENPNKIALSDGKKMITYSELWIGILGAKELLSTTYLIQSKDTIIISADKQLSFAYIYFAAHLLGAIVVPIDPETNETRFNYIYQKINPKLIIGFKKDTNCQNASFHDFENTSKHIFEKPVFPLEEQIADIIFTTGTTGTPKGVVLTHKNISAAASNINSFIRNSSDDIEILALPISHSFGLGRLRCILSKGATLILLGNFANIKRFYRYIDEFKVTGLAVVPSSWTMLKNLSGLRLADFANQLHYIEIGSAPMPINEKELLLNLFPNTRICMHYGLTEASRAAFIEFHEESTHLDTVGKASPNMDIQILDEKGNKCQVNEEGEICVKGDAVTNGYWKEHETNTQFFHGQYFRTGDWGCIDTNGYITLKSRKKELINVGGKKVSPIEVENILRTITGIKDCVCVGIDDPQKLLGEVVKAFIVPEKDSYLSEKENLFKLSKQLSGKIENYKIPVEYEIIQEVPRTTSGKIQRLLLKNK